MDVDNYVLRLLLNTALLDLPPHPTPTAPLQPPEPRPYSYCDPMAGAMPPYKNRAGTQARVLGNVRRSVEAFPPPPPSYAWRPPPSPSPSPEGPLQQGGWPSEQPYQDAASYQQARILERASHYDVSRHLQQEAAGGERRRSRPTRARRSALDSTAQERHLFEDAYARFASRLSHLSRQELAADEAEPLTSAMGGQAGERKLQALRMARAVGDSVREVFTDPVVIELIKEVAMIRFRQANEREQRERGGQAPPTPE